MIRGWIIIVLVVAVGAALAYWLRLDAGYVVLNYQGWIIETSALALALLILMGAPLTLWLIRLLLQTLRLPGTLSRMRQDHRKERAKRSFRSGMNHLLSGQWQRAEIELVRRAADHDAPQLNYLQAARAAQRLGALERRDRYLELAKQSDSRNTFAALLSNTELLLERGEFAAAKQLALRLRELEPRHAYCVALLAECHAGLGEWPELLDLLSHTDALGEPSTRRKALLQRSLIERIKDATQRGDLDDLKALWNRISTKLRDEHAVRLAYVRGLQRLDAHGEAGALIVTTLRKQWDADLVAIYGKLDAADPVARLATIEQWLSNYGERPELLITAGRACLANKLWGKARSYLEAAQKAGHTPEAFLELARLCEQTQNADEAQQLYKQGLELATR